MSKIRIKQYFPETAIIILGVGGILSELVA